VNNTALVNVLESIKKLENQKSCFVFRKKSLLFKVMEQFASFHEFCYDEDLVGIFIDIDQFNNMRMLNDFDNC